MKNYDWLTVRSSRSVEQMRLWSDNPRLNPELDYTTIHNFADGICGDKGDRDAFIALAESITSDGFIPADPIVVWKNPDNDKFYVAEGNRRVLAIKLLLSPQKAPAAIRAKISTLSKKIEDIDSIKKIKVAVAPTFEDAEWYIFQRHSSAALQRKWSREQQFRYIAKIFADENCNAINTQLRTNLLLSEVYNIIRTLKLKEYSLKLETAFSVQEFGDLKSYQFPLSTFERFLEDSNIIEKLHIQYEDDNVFSAAVPEEFNNALVILIKGIVSKGDDKISSRTSPELVKNRLPEITKSEKWSLGDNSLFITSGIEAKKKRKNQPNPQKGDKNNPKRQKMIPMELSLNSSNVRLCGIWGEMQKISTSKFCNISSAALRIFLDLTIKEFLDGQNLIADIQRKCNGRDIRDITLKQRLEYLRSSDKLPKNLRGDITKLLNSENDFSLDVLNGYIHSPKTCYVGPEFLNRFWDFLYPIFEHILDISDTDDGEKHE